MLSIYLEQVLKSDSILVSSLERIRDFVHVFDVVDIVQKCLDMKHDSGLKINVCSSRPTKVSDLLSKISLVLNKEISIKEAESTQGDTFEHWDQMNFVQIYLKRSWITLDDGLKQTVDAYNTGEWFTNRFV